MPTADRSKPPAPIWLCADSRMRCIDGEFIAPPAPVIIRDSGLVCRPRARLSCATAVARCCSREPRGAFRRHEFRGDRMDDALERAALQELGQRLGAGGGRHGPRTKSSESGYAYHGGRPAGYSSRSFKFGTAGASLTLFKSGNAGPVWNSCVSL